MKTKQAIGGGFSKGVGLTLILFALPGVEAGGAESSPDLTGPRLVAAINTAGTSGFGSNTINVLPSEPVNSATASDTNNYTLTMISGTNRIPILRAIYSASLGILLTVDGANADWVAQSDYVLTVNNLRDTSGNVIAPDTQVGVSRPLPSQLLFPASAIWSHHAGYSFDPDIFDDPWEMPDYVESSWWQHGRGPFCEGNGFGQETNWTACLGPCQSLMLSQLHPALFRTSFLWPTNSGHVGYLTITTEADDAIIVYLNGHEIWRNNLSRQITRLSANSQFAIIWEFPPGCVTRSIFVTNLLSGTNWFAAGVVPALVGNDVKAFAMQVSGASFQTPTLPDAPPPTLDVAPLGSNLARFWWAGRGFALEYVTNLNGHSASYPFGPWQEVSNMANPYTNSLAGPQRFFRLKR